MKLGDNSTRQNTKKDDINFLKMMDDKKISPEDKKLKLTNLSKRKPAVEKTQIKVAPMESKKSSLLTAESATDVEPSKSKTAFGKGSSSADQPALALLNIGMKAPDAIRVAGALIEGFNLLRNSLSADNQADKTDLYLNILQFCDVCSSKPDEELKEMVIKRVGSYLTAIYQLLSELEHLNSDLHSATVKAVCQLIAMIKQKTLSYVTWLDRSSLASSRLKIKQKFRESLPTRHLKVIRCKKPKFQPRHNQWCRSLQKPPRR